MKKKIETDVYTYEGDYRFGKMTGKGIIKWKNGDVYDGDFVDGKRTGKGKYTWADGDVYEGDFIDDKRTGKGKFTYANGDVLEGDFVDGERIGNGKLTEANGRVYALYGNLKVEIISTNNQPTKATSENVASPFKYDCFISYKSADKDMADAVYEYLTNKGLKVFYALRTLPKLGKGDYYTTIMDALDSSKHLLIVCREKNIKYLRSGSGFISQEITLFLNEITDDPYKQKVSNILFLVDNVHLNKKELSINLRLYEFFDYNKKHIEFDRILGYLKK